MRRPIVVSLLAPAALGGVFPRGVAAQSPGLDVTAPAPEAPEFGFRPSMPPAQGGSREQEFYPGPVRSRHEPAFLAPFVGAARTTRTSEARWGLSGWTAPALPFDIPQATGGVAFGFTLMWGAPVAARAEIEPTPRDQR